MCKFLLFTIAYLLLTIASVFPVFADDKFSVTYDLSYKVAENGITTVTQNFTLINKTSEFFPQAYMAKIGKQEIANIKAFDKTGPLEIALVGADDNRSVNIKFRQLAAGIGQTLNWTLSYQTSQIAKKQGQTWRIFIPRPVDLTPADSYTIGLYVPSSFGQPYILKPKPISSDHIWSKNELTTNGIFASYFTGPGNNPYQVYDFELRYHLNNPKLYPVETEIALPPDTNYQQVFLNTLVPQPVNVRVDTDGNWLAKFSLGPTASLDVLATGSALVYFRPVQESTVPRPGDYLSATRYWEASDPRIVSLAKRYQTPDKIYQYVRDFLQYDFSRAGNNISRLGASGILNNPKTAICLEFTDLFIAIARAAGIPAREVNGFASSLDPKQQPLTQDALHSWPEYFDPPTGGWRMVDPTWGNTTGGIDYFTSLDTDHLAFAIRGQNSSSPSPAGTYKESGSKESDIEISYHDGPFDPNQDNKLSLRSNIPKTLTAGFPFRGVIYLDNNGPKFYGPAKLALQAGKLEIQNQDQITPGIPPFGHLELPFTVLPLPWTDTDNDIINVQFAGFSKDYPVAISPIYTNKYIFVIGGLTVLGILSIFAQIARSLFWSHRSQKDPT